MKISIPFFRDKKPLGEINPLGNNLALANPFPVPGKGPFLPPQTFFKPFRLTQKFGRIYYHRGFLFQRGI